MILADVHAHLTDSHLIDSVWDIVKRAEEANVKAVITNGLGPSDNNMQLELASRFPIVKAALGFYPTEAETISKPEFNFIIDNAKNIIAIGEIGLDKKDSPDFAHWKRQLDVFSRMLEIAAELNKPVLIHSRKAEREVLDTLSKHETPVIMHCFGGKKGLVKEGLDRGYYYSIPPIIRTSTHFQSLASIADLSRLLTETDSPYLSPEKEKFNEPAFVRVGVEEIAKLKGLDPEEASKAIFKNYMDIF